MTEFVIFILILIGMVGWGAFTDARKAKRGEPLRSWDDDEFVDPNPHAR